MIAYDRATTKQMWGIPPEHEYGRWNGTFANGITSWRRLVQTRITPGTLNTLRILVVGCGMSLMVEGLKDEGFQRVWGIGLNDYFRSLWDVVGGKTSIAMTTNTGFWMDTTTNQLVPEGTAGAVAVGGFYIEPTSKAHTPIAFGGFWPCELRADVRPLLGQYDIRTMSPTQVGTLTGLSGAQRAFDLIITEDVMTGYPLAEMDAVYTGCSNRLASGGSVIHLVSLNADATQWGGAPAMDFAGWTATLGGRANHSIMDIGGITEQAAR